MPNYKWLNETEILYVNGLEFVKRGLWNKTVKELIQITGLNSKSKKRWRKWLSIGHGKTKKLGRVKSQRRPKFVFAEDPYGRNWIGENNKKKEGKK